MAQLDKQIKTFIKDVEKFIAVTLKSVQLPAAAKNERSKLLKSLETIKKKNTDLQQLATDAKNEDKEGNFHTDADDEDMYYEVPKGKEVNVADIKDVVISGQLKKKDKKKFGGSNKKWCVIQQGVFYVFEKQSSKKQTDAYSLNGFQAADATSAKKEFCFEMSGPENRSFMFVATTEEERKKWVEAINKAAKKPTRPAQPEEPDTIYSETDTQDEPYEANDNEGADFYDEATSLLTGKAEDCVPEVIYEDASSRTVDGEEMYGDTSVADKLHPDENSGTSKATVRSSNSDYGYAHAPLIPPKIFEELVYEALYYALWDCTAETDTELDFKRGDIINVIGQEYIAYNWLTCRLNDKIGLVPKNYLTPAFAKI